MHMHLHGTTYYASTSYVPWAWIDSFAPGKALHPLRRLLHMIRRLHHLGPAKGPWYRDRLSRQLSASEVASLVL